jgi:lysophospholipase L1-like esterase
MRRRGCVAALAVLVAGLGATPPAHARPTDDRRAAVWVVGDSVTVYSEPALRARLASTVDGRVEVNAVSGRNVSELDNLVRSRLAQGSRPRAMVLALGTNPDPVWTRSDYRRVLDSIPDSITVVLVTVYRQPGTAPAGVVRELARYSRWVRELAGSRENVCVAPWRARVQHRPERYTLDGMHPNDRGANVFADLVAAAVVRCSNEPGAD